MKKTKRSALRILCGAILAALLISVSGLASLAFAEPAQSTPSGGNVDVTPISSSLPLALERSKTSPKDGSTSLQMQNVGIKLYFDGDITVDSNKKCFKFTDSKGYEIPCEAVFDASVDKNYILIQVEPEKLKTKDKKVAAAHPEAKSGMLQSKKHYNLTISGSLSSTDGRTLGDTVILKYRTLDQSSTTRIYTLLMVLMVVGMIALTIFQNKRKAKATAEVAVKEGKVNPYKLAKEKNISVKEAMDIIERDRQRREKRLLKAGVDPSGKNKDEKSLSAPDDKPKMRVSRPRPISESGGKYKTGRKALVEKKAKENEKKLAAAAAKKKSGNNKKKTGKKR